MARQARLSMGFPRQEYWSGLPFPPAGDLPDPGIQPTSLALAGGFRITEPSGKPRKVLGRFFCKASDQLVWVCQEGGAAAVEAGETGHQLQRVSTQLALFSI